MLQLLSELAPTPLMPMLWRETYPDICLFLSDVYSAEHDAFEEDPEVVRTKGVTLHAVSLEVFQILNP